MGEQIRKRRTLLLMQTRITEDEIDAATRQLAKSPRGRADLRRLDAALETEDFCLDLLDQRAFLALLGGAWAGQRPKVREAMRNRLSETE